MQHNQISIEQLSPGIRRLDLANVKPSTSLPMTSSAIAFAINGQLAATIKRKSTKPRKTLLDYRNFHAFFLSLLFNESKEC